MDFKTEKKGYNKSEVDAYIFNLVKNYEQSLARSGELNEQLKAKLEESERKNKAYKDKESLVSKAITSAVAKADEIDRLAQLKYSREMQQLKAFHDKWLSYYDKILKKYPLNDELIGVGKFNEEMSRILNKAREGANARSKQQENKEESQQNKPTRIGYTEIDTDSVQASEENIPEDDILSRDFDPVDRIREYLIKEHPKKQSGGEKETAAVETEEKEIAEDYADRSESGFSFEEALNPQEDLADIMRDLGLLMDE